MQRTFRITLTVTVEDDQPDIEDESAIIDKIAIEACRVALAGEWDDCYEESN